MMTLALFAKTPVLKLRLKVTTYKPAENFIVLQEVLPRWSFRRVSTVDTVPGLTSLCYLRDHTTHSRKCLGAILRPWHVDFVWDIHIYPYMTIRILTTLREFYVPLYYVLCTSCP